MTIAVRPLPLEGLPTRRALRLAEASAAPSRRRSRRSIAGRLAMSVFVSGLTAGIVATVALPSYAFDPVTGAAPLNGASGAPAPGPTQALAVDGDVQQAATTADRLTATLPPAVKRRELAKQFAQYTGPSAAEYAADPHHLPFSLASVFATAESYMGVPYVFGGADPSGMDCSGFVMFVYAQYGVSVAHSVHMEDAAGVRISKADARPGDLVVFDDLSHIGFYAGHGRILDAPDVGRNIQERAIWSSAVHYVRLGLR